MAWKDWKIMIEEIEDHDVLSMLKIDDANFEKTFKKCK